jgi:hypothetical protein
MSDTDDDAAFQEWRVADIQQALTEADADDFASDQEVTEKFEELRSAAMRRKSELS